ncbi:ribonuclease-like protein hi large subunit [Periconia macrospinosa]|uniref:Ribonuclease n=1 Tax=Periconia macrospinosa TaxID=97972 RepID=A0A2V1EDH7_9PLEO|nr:ribonuclease-like protein hi large subunit [Periconia macrospinosa]
MADTQDIQMETQESALETPPPGIFVAPSVHKPLLFDGESYSHFSPIPSLVANDLTTECVLGVDEAGRGPVLGPMVYALFYLPLQVQQSLLAETHHFDDSKVLTPEVRSDLMRKICTKDTDLYNSCGWATRLLSARDISAHMSQPAQYNLNAQAMDATIDLIKGVLAQGVNVKEIYIDTIGKPEIYQKKLERIWPTIRITVAKKADSLYPVVSAASVCAKVTRDAALEACWEARQATTNGAAADAVPTWGSGYPSDAKTVAWLKQNMDPVFGWGNECRFSWGTAKQELEVKNKEITVDWPVEDDTNGSVRITDHFISKSDEAGDELVDWFGSRVTMEMEAF